MKCISVKLHTYFNSFILKQVYVCGCVRARARCVYMGVYVHACVCISVWWREAKQECSWRQNAKQRPEQPRVGPPPSGASGGTRAPARSEAGESAPEIPFRVLSAATFCAPSTTLRGCRDASAGPRCAAASATCRDGDARWNGGLACFLSPLLFVFLPFFVRIAHSLLLCRVPRVFTFIFSFPSFCFVSRIFLPHFLIFFNPDSTTAIHKQVTLETSCHCPDNKRRVRSRGNLIAQLYLGLR